MGATWDYDKGEWVGGAPTPDVVAATAKQLAEAAAVARRAVDAKDR